MAVFFAIASVAAFFFATPGALDWRPALAGAEPWRAWSAALLHLSGLHLAANVAGAVAVALLGWSARVPRRSALAWLVSWPLTQFGLLARPDLERFAGLSGVLHAGVACVAVALIAEGAGGHAALVANSDSQRAPVTGGQSRRQTIGVAILAVLFAKVASETPWAEPLRHPAGWDIATAPFAHASGAVAGLIVAMLAEAIGRGRVVSSAGR